MRTGRALLALLCATALGCAHGNQADGEGYPLTTSMDARVVGDSVHLTLHVTNVSAAPLELEYSSSQEYDFQVREEGGESVWTWSADRSFMQVLTTDTLAPGDTRRYSVAWAHGGRTGSYVASGRLLADDHEVELAIPLPLD